MVTSSGGFVGCDLRHLYTLIMSNKFTFYRPAIFVSKNLLGCGYVGNKEVVHISTARACRTCLRIDVFLRLP